MIRSYVTTHPIGLLAVATGGVTLIGIGCLILLFTVGGIFGPFNDLCNGVEAILSALLAWWLLPWLRTHAPQSSRF